MDSSSVLEKHLNISVSDIIPSSPNKKVSNSKKIIEEVKYNKLAEDTDMTYRPSPSKGDEIIEVKPQQKDDEFKILQNVKLLLNKFDACGDVLFSLNSNYSNTYSRTDNENFINIFFSNLLVFGSYKLKNSIASNKEVAYKAGTVK